MIYRIEISGTQLDLIGKALGAFPYAQVADLMDNLRQQARAQEQPAEPKDDSKSTWVEAEPPVGTNTDI